MGASLLIFLNKTDVGGCMTESDIHEVRQVSLHSLWQFTDDLWFIGSSIRCHQNAQMGNISMQCYDRKEFARRAGLGGPRCEGQTFSVLMYKVHICKGRYRYATTRYATKGYEIQLTHHIVHLDIL